MKKIYKLLSILTFIISTSIVGFGQTVSIGGYVFIDTDKNGTGGSINNNEIPLGGASVQLYSVDGNGTLSPVGTPVITTNYYYLSRVAITTQGSYYFNNLQPGNYVVGVTPPSPMVNASATTSTDDGKNHGTQSVVGGESRSAVITLAVGSMPVNGTTTTTNELTAGGGAFSNTLDDADGDANGNTTIDFGFWGESCSIGSSVFLDLNNSGGQGPGEGGLVGASIQLYSSNSDGSVLTPIGNPYVTISTASSSTVSGNTAAGTYIFANLAPGTYVVGVTPPAIYPRASTGSANIVTDVSPATDARNRGTQTTVGGESKSPVITLSIGGEPVGTAGEGGLNGTADNATGLVDANGDMTVDFGFHASVGLGSTIFHDKDFDGLQDADEGGLAGATVQLYAASGGVRGAAIGTPIVTGADGSYYFSGLSHGSYIVGVKPPAAFPLSSPVTVTTDIRTDDGQDNGTQAASGDEAFSPSILLATNVESTTAEETGTNSTLDDANELSSDMTVDFGFYSTTQQSVDLLDFNAKQNGKLVNLSWKTANEKDFSHFEIEKSLNGNEFESILKINASNLGKYFASDANPIENLNYYRLKMVDNDGTFKLSKVISINYNRENNYVSFENPVKGGLLNVNTNLKNPKFVLMNGLGKVVSIKTNQINSNNYQINVNQILSGIYYLVIDSNGNSTTRKVFFK